MKISVIKKVKKMLLLIAGLAVLSLSCSNIEENKFQNECYEEEDKRVIKELKNELAYVRIKCFEHLGRTEAFYFELASNYPDIHSPALFPIGEIPKQYRKDGLSVFISGNVLSCLEVGGCIEPHLKLRPINLFEIKCIKITQ